MSESARHRTIRVNMLTRVEGEGALFIKLKGDKVIDVKLNIFEPPRMFEAFLHGRHFSETPDIVARICGICPVAYQMSAVHAFERALDIRIDPMVAMLRRLFYCGEWIESHALHVYLLHAPDFLGYPDAIQMARDHRGIVEQGLRLKKIGNRIVSLLGGREIHPVSAAVGGFYKVPSERELGTLTEDLKQALDTSLATVKLVAGFEFPDFERDYEFVALSHPGEYPLNEGRIVSSKGLNIFVPEYEEHFVERHVKHSNALQSAITGRGPYFVGPLARFNLNFAQLPPVARQAAHDSGLRLPCLNPFRSIVVRAVELVFACWEALQIVAEYRMPETPKVDFEVRAGMGCAATEAPRGLLYHRYKIDEHGLIRFARIVPPTSQNQKQIEDDLWHFVPGIASLPLEKTTWKCEQAVRNYDPCISCATHALRVTIEHQDPAPVHATTPASGTLILGCGNPDRTDDAAGLLVASRLRDLGRDARPYTGDMLALIDQWTGHDHVIIIDAMRGHPPAGAIQVWDARTTALPKESFRYSSHEIGLAEVLALAASTNRLPPDLTVYGIGAGNCGHGASVSTEVALAIESVAQQITRSLNA